MLAWRSASGREVTAREPTATRLSVAVSETPVARGYSAKRATRERCARLRIRCSARGSRRAENSRSALGVGFVEAEYVPVVRAPAKARGEDPRAPGIASSGARQDQGCGAAVPLPLRLSLASAWRSDGHRGRARRGGLVRVGGAEAGERAVGLDDERDPFGRAAVRALADRIPRADAPFGRLRLGARQRNARQAGRLDGPSDAPRETVGAIDGVTERARELCDLRLPRLHPLRRATARAPGPSGDPHERRDRNGESGASGRREAGHTIRKADPRAAGPLSGGRTWPGSEPCCSRRRRSGWRWGGSRGPWTRSWPTAGSGPPRRCRS